MSIIKNLTRVCRSLWNVSQMQEVIRHCEFNISFHAYAALHEEITVMIGEATARADHDELTPIEKQKIIFEIFKSLEEKPVNLKKFLRLFPEAKFIVSILEIE